ncbi:MAG: hypothetical protein ABSE80_13350 [Halobacteriota archaeon]
MSESYCGLGRSASPVAGIDAQIFTGDFSGLGQKLEHDVAKTSAVNFSRSAITPMSDNSLGIGESL